VFGVSRASSISFDATVGSAHGLGDILIDGANEGLLFACSVGEVGGGRDDGCCVVDCRRCRYRYRDHYHETADSLSPILA
jgi:hypothetical protein